MGGKERKEDIKPILWDLAHTITITVSAQMLTLSEAREIQVGNIESVLNAQSYTDNAWKKQQQCVRRFKWCFTG